MEIAYEMSKARTLYVRPLDYYDSGCVRFGDDTDEELSASFDAFCEKVQSLGFKVENTAYAEAVITLGKYRLQDVMTESEATVAHTRFVGMSETALEETLPKTRIGAQLQNRAELAAKATLRRLKALLSADGYILEEARGLIEPTCKDCPSPRLGITRMETPSSVLD